MKDVKVLDVYFLCGIGHHGIIYDFQVGIYDATRKSFRFSNGDHSCIELYKEPKGSNATYVINSLCLEEVKELMK